MKQLIECVPNISEGRDMNIINQGVAEVDAVAHQAGSLQRRQALAHHAVIHRFRLFRRPYAGNQHQHRQHQAEQVQEPLLHIHRSFLLRI